MKGQIHMTVVSGWAYAGHHRLRPGVFSNHYRHACGMTAKEVKCGWSDETIFLSVFDEKGRHIGTVKNASELP